MQTLVIDCSDPTASTDRVRALVEEQAFRLGYKWALRGASFLNHPYKKLVCSGSGNLLYSITGLDDGCKEYEEEGTLIPAWVFLGVAEFNC